MAEAFGGPTDGGRRAALAPAGVHRGTAGPLGGAGRQGGARKRDCPPIRHSVRPYRATWSGDRGPRWRLTAPPAAPRWDWGPAGPPSPRPAPIGRRRTDSRSTLPGPDETVSFAAHVKPLFRERDRKSMRFAFDLWSQADVQATPPTSSSALRDGTMPCDGAWPPEKIDVFQRWTETGIQPWQVRVPAAGSRPSSRRPPAAWSR